MGIDTESGRAVLARPRKGDVILCANKFASWRVRSVSEGVVCIRQTLGELRGLVWYMRLTDYVAAFKEDRILRAR